MNKTYKKRKHNTHNKTKKHDRVFSKKDYYSGDGFLTTVWGPAAWHLLHTISFNYPVEPTSEQKKQYRDFIDQNLNKFNLYRLISAKPLTT